MRSTASSVSRQVPTNAILSFMKRHQEKTLVQFFLFSTFVGLIVALYTLWHHIAINNNVLEGSSFCNVSSYVNCDAVALSPYSQIGFVPVAAFMVIFYGVLLVLGLSLFFAETPSGKNSEESLRARKLRSSIFTLSIVGLVPTVIYAGISFFVLKLVCVLCIATYLINIVLWALSLKIVKKNPPGEGFSPFALTASLWPIVITTILLALVPLMIRGSMNASKIDDNLLRSVLSSHFSKTAASISTEGFPSIGPVDAKVTIVEYSDFQCPYCARASTVVPEVARAAPGVRFVFKNFPLDPNCNPTMQGAGHPLACVAAKTGHCVFKNKGNEAFFAYEKKAFSNQSKLSRPYIEELGLESGLSKADLKACIESPETHASMVAQSEEGKAVGVSGTPAVFVNGRVLEYGSVAKVLKAVIARYLETTANAGK